jgi:hypothetical protein
MTPALTPTMTQATPTPPSALQDEFARALLDPEREVPADMRARDGDIDRRFAVYRNNVVTGLIDALRAGFPAVERIVGEEFFVAMAHVYVRARPPRAPMMFLFGDDFGDFIATFPPAAEIPYLADIARVETARLSAFHAADEAPLEAAALAGQAPGALFELRVTTHPSLHVVRSAYPIATIWAMNAGITEPAPIEDWTGEDVAVARPYADVTIQRLRPGAAILLDLLGDAGGGTSLTLGAAIARVAAQFPEFDPVAVLADILGAGLLTGSPRSSRSDPEAP